MRIFINNNKTNSFLIIIILETTLSLQDDLYGYIIIIGYTVYSIQMRDFLTSE